MFRWNYDISEWGKNISLHHIYTLYSNVVQGTKLYYKSCHEFVQTESFTELISHTSLHQTGAWGCIGTAPSVTWWNWAMWWGEARGRRLHVPPCRSVQFECCQGSTRCRVQRGGLGWHHLQPIRGQDSLVVQSSPPKLTIVSVSLNTVFDNEITF